MNIFCGESETTSWDIMKKVYRDGGNKEHMIIKRRIIKMGELGLFKKIDEPPKPITWELSEDVEIKKYKFKDKYKDALFLMINNKWRIYEI